MSHEGYSVLRQICIALDTNSEKRMQQIANKYKGSKELTEAMTALRTIAEKQTYYNHVAERLRLLSVFETNDWKPELKFLIKTGNKSTAKYVYDISDEEFTNLRDIS